MKKKERAAKTDRPSGRASNLCFDVNEVLLMKDMYEKGWSLAEIAKNMHTTGERVSDLAKEQKWKKFTEIITEDNQQTLVIDIPAENELSTIQLVQLQNLSRIDYMLATGDLLLQRLRSESQAVFRIPMSMYHGSVVRDQKSSDKTAGEISRLSVAFDKLSRPVVNLLKERLELVRGMPNLIEEGSFEDKIKGALLELDGEMKEKRMEYQRSVMPDVAYDEKTSDVEARELKEKLELVERMDEIRKKGGGGRMKMSGEIV